MVQRGDAGLWSTLVSSVSKFILALLSFPWQERDCSIYEVACFLPFLKQTKEMHRQTVDEGSKDGESK